MARKRVVSTCIRYIEGSKRSRDRSSSFGDISLLQADTFFVDYFEPLVFEGATIVDQQVTVALASDYKLPVPPATAIDESCGVKRAEDVVSSMLAKGFSLGKDGLNKAKSFDQKHQLTAKVASLDQKIGLSEKMSASTSMVNDKVRQMDDKFEVSEKTKSAVTAAGSAVLAPLAGSPSLP